jgi:site-specific DNA recombinase
MKNVVAYCRVSTDGQVGEDKFGIDAQKEQIMDYCAKNDMQISAWYIDEGVSGAKEERPEFDKILFSEEAVVNPPVAAVVVAKSDRIARDINIYFYYKMLLRKKDIQLISIAEDFGQFGVFSSMLEAFTLCVAEMERANITKRTSSGRAIKAARGGYSGGRTPFGYRAIGGNMVVVPEEAETVRQIFGMKESGSTYQNIVDALNGQGKTNKSGTAFAISTIQTILGNRKVYEGYYKYGKTGEWVKGQHEAIFEES